MIFVCFVDDQNLVCQGVCLLLDLVEDICVVVECVDGVQVVLEILWIKFDVVLLDLCMFNMSGLEVLQVLFVCNELLFMIIFIIFDDDQLVLQGLKVGVCGYLLKDVLLEQLVEVVCMVVVGGLLVVLMVIQCLFVGVGCIQNQFISLEQFDFFIECEMEILWLFFGGYFNKEIVNLLKVVEGMVKNYVLNIFLKFGVCDCICVVLKVLELGIV